MNWMHALAHPRIAQQNRSNCATRATTRQHQRHSKDSHKKITQKMISKKKKKDNEKRERERDKVIGLAVAQHQWLSRSFFLFSKCARSELIARQMRCCIIHAMIRLIRPSDGAFTPITLSKQSFFFFFFLLLAF